MFLLLLLLLFVSLLLILPLGWLSVKFCPLCMLCLQLSWCHRLFRSYVGKLQAHRASLICSNSLWSDCWLVETTLALWAKVLIMLCFAMMKWLLSKCMYRSVCVGFLYTEVVKVLLGPGETKYPGMVDNLLCLVPSWWIVCMDLLCWCVAIVVGCVLPPRCQTCYLHTLATSGRCGAELKAFTWTLP